MTLLQLIKSYEIESDKLTQRQSFSTYTRPAFPLPFPSSMEHTAQCSTSEVRSIRSFLVTRDIVKCRESIGGFEVHSYALAVSGLRTPLSCHHTLTSVSLSAGFALTALASVSITPKQEARSRVTGARAVRGECGMRTRRRTQTRSCKCMRVYLTLGGNVEQHWPGGSGCGPLTDVRALVMFLVALTKTERRIDC
jgi:hypothetical protein